MDTLFTRGCSIETGLLPRSARVLRRPSRRGHEMFTIGDRVPVQDLLDTPDIALVASETESAIVREYTYEEILQTRQSHPEVLGGFTHLSAEEIHRELQDYESFFVEVGNDDYSLVIGFSGSA